MIGVFTSHVTSLKVCHNLTTFHGTNPVSMRVIWAEAMSVAGQSCIAVKNTAARMSYRDSIDDDDIDFV
jgi:hypothetical protein